MDEAPPKTEYEVKKEARERQEQALARQAHFKKIIKWALLIILLALLIWGIVAVVFSQIATGPDFSKSYEIQSRDHIVLKASHPEYNSNPPSGGWHYAQTARRDFYEVPIPDEHIVHNLEHGDVWIAYHPRVSADIKKALKDFLYTRVIITPREANDTDISLVAWGRVDSFNLDGGVLPKERIDDFIKRYRGKGPEDVPVNMNTSFN